MRLTDGGIDVFYIDESADAALVAMSAVRIPFLRSVAGTWTLVWEDQFANMRSWRRRLSASHGIPVRKELKGSKLISGRGRYAGGKHQLPRPAAMGAYRSAMSGLGFLPESCIISVVADCHATLYGHTRLEAVLYALLQRMQKACEASGRTGLLFFDEGHGEYRTLYRKARVYLPTGSALGGWPGGRATKNLPLANFTKDANFKQSHHCWFTQLADLLSFAVLLKVRAELGHLPSWQNTLGAGALYDAVPRKALNVNASRKDSQGIVRL